MPWEHYILSKFQRIPKNPPRGAFHGPYSNLMFSLFPPESDFDVAPRFKWGPYPSPYFRFDILFDRKTVLMLELKRPGDLQYSSKRQEAIREIQRRIKNLRPECPPPVLHAVSAFGTKLCFCQGYCNQPMQPPSFPAHPEGVMDLAPQEYWDCDILEEEGEKRFKSMIEEIKRGCAALR